MKPYAIGIDAGSTFYKAVLLQGDTLRGKAMQKSGWQPAQTAALLARQLVEQAGVRLEDCAVVCTGYGRESIPFAQKTLTEITCHARGALLLAPQTQGIVDIGGQDCKVIRLAGDRVTGFEMNDKCAAGTGRFLDMACRAVDVPIDALDEFCSLAHAASINSMCTVFAESEIIGLIAAQTGRDQILGGVVLSIAQRIALMIAKLGFARDTPLLMTGGAAKSASMVRAISQTAGRPILSNPDSPFAGAIGAALSA